MCLPHPHLPIGAHQGRAGCFSPEAAHQDFVAGHPRGIDRRPARAALGLYLLLGARVDGAAMVRDRAKTSISRFWWHLEFGFVLLVSRQNGDRPNVGLDDCVCVAGLCSTRRPHGACSRQIAADLVLDRIRRRAIGTAGAARCRPAQCRTTRIGKLGHLYLSQRARAKEKLHPPSRLVSISPAKIRIVLVRGLREARYQARR